MNISNSGAREKIRELYPKQEWHLKLNDEDEAFKKAYPRHWAIMRDLVTGVKSLNDRVVSDKNKWYLTKEDEEFVREVVRKMRRVIVKRGFPWIENGKDDSPYSILNREIVPKTTSGTLRAAIAKHYPQGSKILTTVSSYNPSDGTYGIKIKRKNPTAGIQSVFIQGIKREEFELLTEGKP